MSQTDDPRHPAPFVPASESPPESTWLAIVLGLVLSIIMAAANTYMGLKVGMTVSASIPAAVISMALLRGLLRRGSILENNTVQTMASTGESLAAGVIFTIPAMIMVGAWTEFEFWSTSLIVLLGGLLGIVFMVPMRRALIVDRPDLTYPEGVACAEVLIAGERGGSGVRAIGLGLAIGATFSALGKGLHIIKDTVETAIASGQRVLYAGTDMSPMLVAVGYIVGLDIAVLITMGGAFGWLIAIPALGGLDPASGTSALDHAWDLWGAKVRYIGVGAMVVGGFHSIWAVRKGIVDGIIALKRTADTAGSQDDVARTDRDMPLAALLVIFGAATLGTLGLYRHLTGSMAVAVPTTLVMIVGSFLFVAVATYIAGLVGSSNSPVSGMTICAILGASGFLYIVGVSGSAAIVASLGVAGVVCCATCTSGDIAQDLKTGLLVGATPRRQQWAEVLSCVVTSFTFAWVLSVLHDVYGIGTGKPGALLAPQAALFASLAEGFFGDGTIEVTMIAIGAAIGGGLIILNLFLEASGTKFRAHVMPVAVGIYLPLSLDVPIVIGGLLHYFIQRRTKRDDDTEHTESAAGPGILFGSGLIAGESLMGILIAIVIYKEVQLPTWVVPGWVSLVLFSAVVAFYAWYAGRKEPHSESA